MKPGSNTFENNNPSSYFHLDPNSSANNTFQRQRLINSVSTLLCTFSYTLYILDFSRLKFSLVWSFCASAVHNWMVRELKQGNINPAATIRMPFIRENFPRSLGTKRVQGQEKWWSFDGKRFVLLYIWIFFEFLYFNVQDGRQGLFRVLLVVVWWQKICIALCLNIFRVSILSCSSRKTRALKSAAGGPMMAKCLYCYIFKYFWSFYTLMFK